MKLCHYLGFIIEAGKGIWMNPEKVQAIVEWQAPHSVRAIQAFLGFANFYHQFIRMFSELTAPLIELTKKDVPFKWMDCTNKVFERLKSMFVSAPILLQFNSDCKTVVEVNSSGYVVGGLLMQYNSNGILHPCAFFLKKNDPAECNYKIYDKELLAIVKCLKEWSSKLQSVQEFLVITNHKNLTYFTTTRQLNEWQIHWQEFLSQFNFQIHYQLSKDGQMPDILSQCEQDMPEGMDE